MQPIDKLKPIGPTPENEMCCCRNEGPIMLRSELGAFPVFCMRCNGEMPLNALLINDELAEEISAWVAVHDALYTLWLDSGEYEEWAKQKLLDPESEVNALGLKLAKKLNEQRKTYFWFFRDSGIEDLPAPVACPFCNGPLEDFNHKNYQICVACQVAV